MSTIATGITFHEPVTQTILPVAEVVIGRSINGRRRPVSATIVGFFPITSTEFDGTETEITLASGQANITSLRLPPHVGGSRAPEFMVASYTTDEARHEAWRGHSSFVEAAKGGYYSSWIMPASLITYRHGLGALVGSLVDGLDSHEWITSANPASPSAINGSLKWAVSLSLTNNACGFFDFNWIDLFQAKPPVGVEPASITGLAIIPTTQPAGQFFKSTVLQHPIAGSNGTVIYNTVRVIRMLQDVPAGDHTFGFTIGYTDANGKQASVAVTLTLTVV